MPGVRGLPSERARGCVCVVVWLPTHQFLAIGLARARRGLLVRPRRRRRVVVSLPKISRTLVRRAYCLARTAPQ
eukprot:COSAG01_NODE_4526_length_4949_cov_4.355038_4_plen_74_part_00